MPIGTAQVIVRAMIRPGLAGLVGGLTLIGTWTLTGMHADGLSRAVVTTGAMLPRLLLSLTFGVLVVLVLAGLMVRWHRRLLLDERPGLFMVLRPCASDGHCAVLLLAGVIVAHAAFSLLHMVLAVGFDLDLGGPAAVVARLGCGIGMLYIVHRIGLVLPAAALGRAIDLGTSWRLTAVGCHRAFLPVAAVAICCALGVEAVGRLALHPVATHSLRGLLLFVFVAAFVSGQSVSWRRHASPTAP